jgi:hypothetical protein
MAPWLEQTLALQEFCGSNGLPFPPPEVLDVLCISPANSQVTTQTMNTPGLKRGPDRQKRKIAGKPFEFKLPPIPDYGPRPEGAGIDWKAVPLDGASGLNLVLYIIKEAGGAASSSLINARLSILRPGSALSTASMTLHSLKDEGKIAGDFRQWSLKQDVQIVVADRRMWCALEQLRQQDRAALRREVILAALRVNPRMTVAEISECLRRCEWLRGVAVEPDMVKGNMRVLGDEGLVEREGAFWKLKA